MVQKIFRRKEVKYLLTPAQHRQLLRKIGARLTEDQYFQETNCSVYFDTDERYLAIHSLESPLYKEKVRLRSYGVPRLEDTVFLELKKKYQGIGSKRRIALKLADFYAYLDGQRELVEGADTQIEAELDYAFQHYHLQPALLLAYDRSSYVGKAEPGFRVTFDQKVRSRETDLRLELGDHGEEYFQHGEIVMEVKALDSFPLWFTRALAELKIYPAKFSKYGRIMQRRDAG